MTRNSLMICFLLISPIQGSYLLKKHVLEVTHSIVRGVSLIPSFPTWATLSASNQPSAIAFPSWQHPDFVYKNATPTRTPRSKRRPKFSMDNPTAPCQWSVRSDPVTQFWPMRHEGMSIGSLLGKLPSFIRESCKRGHPYFSWHFLLRMWMLELLLLSYYEPKNEVNVKSFRREREK